MTSIADTVLDIVTKSIRCRGPIIWQGKTPVILEYPDSVASSVTASANGGVDINTGSCLMHAPNHLSVHYPLLPDGRFVCHQSMAPKIIFDTTQSSGLRTSPIAYDAGWIPAMSPNAGSRKFNDQVLIASGYSILMDAPYKCVVTAGVSNESTLELVRAVSKEMDYQQKGMLAGGSHVARLQVSTALELACITTADTENKISSAIRAAPQSGDDGFFLHSANAKGNRMRKNIFTINRASNGGSEGASSTHTGGNRHRETGSASSDMPVVILDSQAQASCTGNFAVLSNLKMLSQDIVLVTANGEEMETYMSGSVRLGRFELNEVYFCPEVGSNRIIVSGSVLDSLGYHYGYGRGKCCVMDLRTGRTVGEGRLINGDYIMDYLEIPRDRTPMPEQPAPVSSVWNTFCSALRRLVLNPQNY